MHSMSAMYVYLWCPFKGTSSSWEKRIERSCCFPGYKWNFSKKSKTPYYSCLLSSQLTPGISQADQACISAHKGTFISSIQQHWMHAHTIYLNMTQEYEAGNTFFPCMGRQLSSPSPQTVFWIQDLLRKGHYSHGLWLVNGFFTWEMSGISIPDWGHWRRLQAVHEPYAVSWGATLGAMLESSSRAIAVSTQYLKGPLAQRRTQ